jgi:lysozyme
VRPTAKRAASAAVAVGAVAVAISLIAPWEGRELRAYRDIVGVPTICYGETRGVKMGDVATPEECSSMLAKGVTEFALAIQPCLPPELPEKTHAAFISLAYNIGSQGFCRSSISKYAMAGSLAEACKRIALYNKAGGRVIRGLVNRRAAEVKLCLQGLQG